MPNKQIFHAIVVASLMATFHSVPVAAQLPSDAELVHLEQVVPAALRKARVPGAAVAVVREGEVVFVRGFAVRILIVIEEVRQGVFAAAPTAAEKRTGRQTLCRQ